MKTLRNMIWVLSAAFALWGCTDEDDPTGDNGSASITLSASSIQIGKDGGSETVTVTSSSDWRLAGVCDWAHPSATSGKSGDVVTFTIDSNTGEEARTATFKFFTGASVAPLQVESAPAYTLNLASEQEESITKAAGNVGIKVETNITDLNFAFSNGGEEWLAFDKRVNFAGNTTLSFKAQENTTYKDRSTAITISSELANAPIVVNVTQAKTEAIIISDEETTQMYDLSARTVSFKVKANIDYQISVTKGSDWITNQQVSEPQVGDDGLSTVTVSYDLAEATASRGGTIKVSGNGINRSVNLIQKDPDAKIISIPDSNLRSTVESSGWIMVLSENQCIITEKGLSATSLSVRNVSDLTGIESFVNLTSITLRNCSNLKRIDISGLHNVTTLSTSGRLSCEYFNFGDNPITSFALGQYTYSAAESQTFIGSKLTSLNLNLYSYYQNYDYVTSIDVSECPALQTLNANRGSKVKKLYLKEGQTIPNLTKNDATEIVYK